MPMQTPHSHSTPTGYARPVLLVTCINPRKLESMETSNCPVEVRFTPMQSPRALSVRLT
jgi:hypothetical protein